MGSDDQNEAIFSGILYLVWLLILFFPMWTAPILLPGLEDPTESYALLTQKLLPPGFVALVLASKFANTMSSSDANTISSVITRDILPNLPEKFRDMKKEQSLKLAQISTFVFTALTLAIAINADSFGEVLGLITPWFTVYNYFRPDFNLNEFRAFAPVPTLRFQKQQLFQITGGLMSFIVVKYINIEI